MKLAEVISSKKNWIFNLMNFCLLISSVTTIAAFAESNSPLKCQSKPGLIVCHVIIDEAAIQDIVYNRGNCDAPQSAQSADFDAVRLFIDRMKMIAEKNGGKPEKIQELLLDENGLPRKHLINKVGTMRREMISFGVSEDEADSYLTAYQRIGNDPRGTYRFGDVVNLRVPYSCKLIEYDIAVNGRIWRFSDL